jgi:arylsulfatase A-like enzyme
VSLSFELLAKELPNIVLIYTDDLGYGDLGSYGHPVIQTPHIDKLAKEGIKLTNYYAPSALCSPSRAGLLTGRTPYRTGIKSWIPENSGVYLHDSEITLAELLKGRGYRTALIGKWHLNSGLDKENEPQPQDQGFDYAYGHNAFQTPTNRNPDNIYRNGQALGEVKGYTADIYADEAINWLRQQKPGVPFFLFLNPAEPHTTIENPPEYNDRYKNFIRGKVVPIASGATIPKDKLVPRGPGEYYANITYLDSQLGRVLDEIDSRGLRENTIVIFTSDNGPVTTDWRRWWETNAHGSTGGLKGRKHELYEGGIKVPAIVRYPGVTTAGSVSDQAVIGMDLFTTLIEMTGAEIPDDRPIDGINIEHILRGLKSTERVMFWALPSDTEAEYVIRKGDWKLLADENYRAIDLFNLAEDQLEFFNLVHEKPMIVEQLLQLMMEKLKSIENDPIRPGNSPI